MRRTYGTGSITFDKNANRIIARIRINGKTIKKSFLKNQQKNANDWLNQMIGNPNANTDISVGEWLQQYIKIYRKPFLKNRSYIRIEQSIKKWENIYNIKLKHLSPSIIQCQINSFVENDLSSSSIKKSYEIMKSAINQAIAEKIIFDNPMLTIVIPKTKPKSKIEIFTWKEIGKIFFALKKLQKNKFNNSQKHNFYLFFKILLTTGMRVSELLALQNSKINTVTNTITIDSSKDIDHQIFSSPKTYSGNRIIPILHEKTKKLLYSNMQNSVFLFQNRNGGAVSYQRIFLTWKNVRKITGITKGIHSFRHTFASYMLAYSNYSLAEISEMLGHSSPSITLDTYTHVVKKLKMNQGQIRDKSNKILFY